MPSKISTKHRVKSGQVGNQKNRQKTEKVDIVKKLIFFAGKFFYMFLSIQIRLLNFC